MLRKFQLINLSSAATNHLLMSQRQPLWSCSSLTLPPRAVSEHSFHHALTEKDATGAPSSFHSCHSSTSASCSKSTKTAKENNEKSPVWLLKHTSWPYMNHYLLFKLHKTFKHLKLTKYSRFLFHLKLFFFSLKMEKHIFLSFMVHYFKFM